jgi:protein involved in polysaccharide export with SLBB domain
MKFFDRAIKNTLIIVLLFAQQLIVAQQKPIQDNGPAGRIPGAPETTPARIVDINADDQKYNDSILNARKTGYPIIPGTILTADEAELQKKEALRKKIFGSSIFNNKNLKFEANLNMATPVDYHIGAGDQLIVNFYGGGQATIKVTVQPDGFVVFDKVGLVNVNGLTIDEAKDKIRSRFSLPAGTQMQLSLGDIRSIRVTVIGEAINPGTYSVPSLSSVVATLYQAGGPNEIGSYRNIQVIRNNKVAAQLDLYDFLLKGLKTQDIRLLDQDRILILPYKNRIEIEGEVKKPGIFEIADGETFQSLVDMTGGFTETAYTSKVKVIRNTDRERKIIDLKNEDFNKTSLKNGDIITVEKILERFENQVNINGAVFRPGQYSLTENPSLLALLKSAEGVREDAYLHKIRIIRLKPDLTVSSMSANLAKIQNGEAPDIALQREDRVEISSNFDLKEIFTVGIRGEINKVPVGQLGGADQLVNIDGEVEFEKAPYYNDMTLIDLIVYANGLKESAAGGTIDITRRKKKSGALDDITISSDLSQSFQFKINSNLSLDEAGILFKLEPFDEVFVRASPNYETQQFITITGQVIKPGPYGLVRKDERLSDLLKRAGGISEFAFAEGATLVRTSKLSEVELESKQKQLENVKDTKNTAINLEVVATTTHDRIGIDLEKAMTRPGSNFDLILQDGDILNIPKKPQTVKLSGEVLYPNTTQFDDSYNFRNYISRAGGFTSQSIKRKAYILYANGAVDRTKRILVFNIYPKVRPGSEIIVPQKAKTTTLNEIVGNIGGFTQLITTLLTTYLFITNIK